MRAQYGPIRRCRWPWTSRISKGDRHRDSDNFLLQLVDYRAYVVNRPQARTKPPFKSRYLSGHVRKLNLFSEIPIQAPTIWATCQHQRGYRLAPTPMDIEGLLQALPTDHVCEADFQEEVMALISERIDPRTTDLRALRLSLQDLGRDDVMFLGVSEMMAVWMTETASPAGYAEGIELLRWLADHGLLSAEVNHACAVLNDQSRTTEHAKALAVLAGLQGEKGLPIDLYGEIHFALGTCHLEGVGTPINAHRAAEHLYRSWKAGNSRAAYNLGVLCGSRTSAKAAGSMPNFRLAAHYLAQAAEHGNLRAMCDLAQLHFFACAPGSTDEQGAHLLRVAYAAGHSQAGVLLTSMEQATSITRTTADWARIEACAAAQSSDTARLLHHCGFTDEPAYWQRGPSAAQVRDEVSAVHITTLLVRARSRGYLANNDEFQQVLDRLGTPASREALANDSQLWRRLNIRP